MPGYKLSALRPTVGGRRRRVRKAPARKPSMMALKSLLQGGRRKRRVVRRAPRRVVSHMPMMLTGGRRRVRHRMPRSGRGLWDNIKSGFNAAKDYIKQNRLISQGIKLFPGKYSEPLSEAVHSFGYGRRRRARVGGRVMFPAVYTTGLGGMSATV